MASSLAGAAPALVLPLRQVTAADSTAIGLPVWSIGKAVWLSVGGLCSVAGGRVTYRLIQLDGNGNLTGCSPVITLTAGTGSPDFGAQWIGIPASDPVVTVCSTALSLKVDSITGTWTFNAQAFVPPCNA
jgi:hypothetical protein